MAIVYYRDLDFGIRLDKVTYQAGESAKGTLITRSDKTLKTLKVRELEFSVCGKERHEQDIGYGSRGMDGGLGGSSSSEKYDTFFFEDLSSFLRSIFTFSEVDMKSLAIYRKNLDGVGSSIIPFVCAVLEYTTKRF